MEIKQRKGLKLSYCLDEVCLRQLETVLKEYVSDQPVQTVEWNVLLKNESHIRFDSLDEFLELAAGHSRQIARLDVETFWRNSKRAEVSFCDRGPSYESIDYSVSGPHDAVAEVMRQIDEFLHGRRQWHDPISRFLTTAYVSGGISIITCLAIKSYLDHLDFPTKAMPMIAGVTSGVFIGTGVTYVLGILFPVSTFLIGRSKG